MLCARGSWTFFMVAMSFFAVTAGLLTIGANVKLRSVGFRGVFTN